MVSRKRKVFKNNFKKTNRNFKKSNKHLKLKRTKVYKGGSSLVALSSKENEINNALKKILETDKPGSIIKNQNIRAQEKDICESCGYFDLKCGEKTLNISKKVENKYLKIVMELGPFGEKKKFIEVPLFNNKKINFDVKLENECIPFGGSGKSIKVVIKSSNSFLILKDKKIDISELELEKKKISLYRLLLCLSDPDLYDGIHGYNERNELYEPTPIIPNRNNMQIYSPVVDPVSINNKPRPHFIQSKKKSPLHVSEVKYQRGRKNKSIGKNKNIKTYNLPIDQNEAKAILSEYPIGTYLLREPSKVGERHVSTLVIKEKKDKIQKYTIKKNEKDPRNYILDKIPIGHFDITKIREILNINEPLRRLEKIQEDLV